MHHHELLGDNFTFTVRKWVCRDTELWRPVVVPVRMRDQAAVTDLKPQNVPS